MDSNERHSTAQSKQLIYSAGDCPVCSNSGAVLLLKASDSGNLFFFCPICGVGWRDPPRPWELDEVTELAQFAPNGATLPTTAEARATGYALTELPKEEWLPFLDRALKREA